jgi:hypothetical protein
MEVAAPAVDLAAGGARAGAGSTGLDLDDAVQVFNGSGRVIRIERQGDTAELAKPVVSEAPHGAVGHQGAKVRGTDRNLEGTVEAGNPTRACGASPADLVLSLLRLGDWPEARVGTGSHRRVDLAPAADDAVID